MVKFTPGSFSTIRPAYITMILSERLETIDTSWEMLRMDTLNFFRRFRSSSIILYCVMTSSDVVGSSAIIRAGCSEIAMAMTTRCFIPPLSWCGYAS